MLYLLQPSLSFKQGVVLNTAFTFVLSLYTVGQSTAKVCTFLVSFRTTLGHQTRLIFSSCGGNMEAL